jgi:CPA2 family monovalent cation:H+ antiporter-2
MSVGISIDLAEIMREPVWVVLSVAGLFAIKTTITTLFARLFGFSFTQTIEIGLLLGADGEFAFIVIGLTMSLALLPEPIAQFMLIVVSATMFLTPLAARLGRTLGGILKARGAAHATQLEDDAAPDLADHIVIASYGRTGQLLAQILDRQHIAYLALDLDAARLVQLHATGASVYLGDASRAPMLERVHLVHAAALVVTTNDAAAAKRVVRTARRLQLQLPIVARARPDTRRVLARARGHANRARSA